PCSGPDREPACDARAASRADQASGSAHNSAYPRQRLRSAGNQGGDRARTSADRASSSARRTPRRAADIILGPLRFPGHEHRSGDVLRQLTAEFLAFAEKQGTTPLLLTAHRLVGICLLYLGDIVESLPHFERTIELYDPAEHRSLATRFGQDAEVHVLCYRS